MTARKMTTREEAVFALRVFSLVVRARLLLAKHRLRRWAVPRIIAVLERMGR